MRGELLTLQTTAATRKVAGASYAGDVLPAECAAYMKLSPAALIDVRTKPEWSFSGIPSFGQPLQQSVHCISWVTYPDYISNPDFVGQLHESVPDKDMPVFFLCKVGGRSAQAAQLAAAQGYVYAFNVLYGFEGGHNEHQQRGCVNGWKAEGLPWMQA